MDDDDESAAIAYQEECERAQWEMANGPANKTGSIRVRSKEMAKVSEMIVSKFLKKEDFDEDMVATIKGVKLEDVGNQGEQRWVLYFRELAKGLVLNVTTIRVLEGAYGDDSDGWVGKRVQIYVDPSVSFQGRMTGGLRLRVSKAKTPAPAPAPVAAHDDEFADEIPF